jgi:hypothetical protein
MVDHIAFSAQLSACGQLAMGSDLDFRAPKMHREKIEI